MKRFATVFAAFLLTLLLPVLAHADHYVKFSATTVTGPSSVTPVLTWCTETAPAGNVSPTCAATPIKVAGSCTASGTSDWTGAKGPSGQVTLSPVSSTATYGLSCQWADDTTITFSWTNPTQNVDGSTLTDLDSVVIASRQGAGALTIACTAPVRCDTIKPPLSPKTFTNFSVGAWRAVAFAKNTGGITSAASTEVTVTLLPAETIAKSVTVTVNVPNIVTGFGAF